MHSPDTPCTAFQNGRFLASGRLADVALPVKAALDASAHSPAGSSVLLFDDSTGEVIDLDWRGTPRAFLKRLQTMLPATMPDPAVAANAAGADLDAPHQGATPPRRPGRPRLGVVAREVTLLPRHWAWLASQPSGASVALRKLVEVARRSSEPADRVRQASDVAYRFMSTIAGHEAGFEEASRALFAGDPAGFESRIAGWPVDVQAHLKKLTVGAFPA